MMGTPGIFLIWCPFPKWRQDYAAFQQEVARAVAALLPGRLGEDKTEGDLKLGAPETEFLGQVHG